MALLQNLPHKHTTTAVRGLFRWSYVLETQIVATDSSIRYKNSLLQVALSVYDLDGMDGIYVPGAISRDVAKQSTDNTLQNTGLSNFDPSLGIQAMGAGSSMSRTSGLQY